MTFAVDSAAANAGEDKFRVFGIAEKYVDLDTSERRCNFVNDPRNQFLKVESGGDSLGEFLQAHQLREL
jgi:hypothetical protein